MRHRAKFCAGRLNRCGDMAVYNFSRWRPSVILDFQNLEISTSGPFLGPMCVIVPNFAKVDRTIPEIWPIFDFQDGGRPPSGIFKSCKFK